MRTEITVRNGHVLLGEYIARWWKFDGMWQWEVIQVEHENDTFKIDAKTKEYFEEDFPEISEQGGHFELSMWGGRERRHCDARAKALGYAHVCNADDNRKIKVEVEDIIPEIQKLKAAVADFCREVDIEVDDGLA